MKQDLLTFKDWQQQDLEKMLNLAVEIKQHPADYTQALQGKSIVGLFEKPSLRTRLSFDIGINKLGGHFLYLDCMGGQMAGREDVKDMAANIACWADAIVARVFDHTSLKTLAANSNVPVINALCDFYHPCQALADFLTLKETFGSVSGLHLAYLGDGNNVSNSLMIMAAKLGCNISIVTPQGHEVAPEMMNLALSLATENGTQVMQTTDIEKLQSADVLYTDTWISMGDSTDIADIKEKFSPYQLNQSLLNKTKAKYAMHCQPAHRELEITSEVVDGSQSLILQQAENRMHAQNAILTTLLS